MNAPSTLKCESILDASDYLPHDKFDANFLSLTFSSTSDPNTFKQSHLHLFPLNNPPKPRVWINPSETSSQPAFRIKRVQIVTVSRPHLRTTPAPISRPISLHVAICSERLKRESPTLCPHFVITYNQNMTPPIAFERRQLPSRHPHHERSILRSVSSCRSSQSPTQFLHSCSLHPSTPPHPPPNLAPALTTPTRYPAPSPFPSPTPP